MLDLYFAFFNYVLNLEDPSAGPCTYSSLKNIFFKTQIINVFSRTISHYYLFHVHFTKPKKTSGKESLKSTWVNIHIYIYIYIYGHPQTDCFIVSHIIQNVYFVVMCMYTYIYWLCVSWLQVFNICFCIHVNTKELNWHYNLLQMSIVFDWFIMGIVVI